MKHRRLILSATLAALVAAGCGNALEGVGDLSRDFIHGGTSTSTTTTTLPQAGGGMALTGLSSDVVWVNDELAATAGETPDAVVHRVWQRSSGVDPYVQAGRREIAAALPGIEFPRLVPEKVTYISSQLVFDTQTGTLDVATSAAFGLWTAEPYTVPRIEGQLVVLRVGLRSALPDEGSGDISTFQATDGRELAWAAGDYVYQLYCRRGISEESCFAMADALTSLQLLASLPSADDA
jgi:predicted small secreted protein